MSHLALPFMLVATLVAPAAAGAFEDQRRQSPAPPRAPRQVTEVVIQSRMIVRIPRLPVGRRAVPTAAAPAMPLPPIRWVERKAEKCVPVTQLAAASVGGADSVDLLLSGVKRLRAKLGDDCPALDFYSGFYLKTNPDGQVCARRDSIRSRSGGECRIRSFSALIPSR